MTIRACCLSEKAAGGFWRVPSRDALTILFTAFGLSYRTQGARIQSWGAWSIPSIEGQQILPFFPKRAASQPPERWMNQHWMKRGIKSKNRPLINAIQRPAFFHPGEFKTQTSRKKPFSP